MWLLSAMTITIVALVMWFADHGGTIDTKMTLAEELPELYGRYQSRLTSGYLARMPRCICRLVCICILCAHYSTLLAPPLHYLNPATHPHARAFEIAPPRAADRLPIYEGGPTVLGQCVPYVGWQPDRLRDQGRRERRPQPVHLRLRHGVGHDLGRPADLQPDRGQARSRRRRLARARDCAAPAPYRPCLLARRRRLHRMAQGA